MLRRREKGVRLVRANANGKPISKERRALNEACRRLFLSRLDGIGNGPEFKIRAASGITRKTRKKAIPVNPRMRPPIF